jgi:hypothetical protein
MKQILHGHMICVSTAGNRRDATGKLARSEQTQATEAMIWKT